MKTICPSVILSVAMLLAGCARNTKSVWRGPPTITDAVNLADLPYASFLQAGQIYSAEVTAETEEKQTRWRVKRPPIPHHYAVGFEWLNLPEVKPRNGIWTFKVKDIERWRHDSRTGSIGEFYATYKCEVLAIKDVAK